MTIKFEVSVPVLSEKMWETCHIRGVSVEGEELGESGPSDVGVVSEM